MIFAILKKEFLALRFICLAIFLVFLLFFGYFSLNFIYENSQIHPHSLLWYGYVFLENSPQSKLILLVCLGILCFTMVQISQQKSQIKCLLHLPISSFKMMICHQIFAFLFFAFLWIIFGIWLLILFFNFYPSPILWDILLSWSYAFLCGVVLYFLFSSLILHKNRSVLLFCLPIFSLALALIYLERSFVLALVFAIFGLVFSYNSVISHRQSSLKFGIFILAFCLLALVKSWQIYSQNFAQDSEKYYIFYSPLKKEFLYQENLGAHRFAYKSASGFEFKTQNEYKNELPFNYFMDLKQQNRLPIFIDGKKFDENEIKNSRMSINFTSHKNPKIKLFPLFNPNSQISAIPFSQNMIFFAKNELIVFHHHGKKEQNLTKFFNKKAENLGVKFPIKDVFGKFSNLKPFDAGIVFKDSNGRFFNIKIYDNEPKFDEIKSLANFEILQINENKNSEILGIAFYKNRLFLVGKDFKTTLLDLPKFEDLNINLRLSLDPKYLQVRFFDNKSYKAFVFDKFSLKRLDEFEIK